MAQPTEYKIALATGSDRASLARNDAPSCPELALCQHLQMITAIGDYNCGIEKRKMGRKQCSCTIPQTWVVS